MRITKQDLEVHIYHNGNWYISWHKKFLCHREDGPAEVWKSRFKYYYVNGQLYKNRDKYWKEVHENY